MKKRKLISSFIIILLPLLLSGCFNYKDVNKVSFATSVIFDLDEYKNPIVYIDCVKPYRSTNDSSDKGRRIIYKGQGKSTSEAIDNINLASGYELNFTQTRAYIFTDKAAEEGISEYLDFVNNGQEFSIKPSMFVFYGKIDELLEITTGDEEYLGLYLEEVVHKNTKNARAMQANINDYISNSLMASNTAIIGVIDVREDALDKKVEINGGAVLKDNILMERITIQDAFSYNLLMDNIQGGTLEIANPQSQGSYITLEILGSKTESNIEYKKDEDKVTLIKDVEMRVSLAEAQGRLLVDKPVLDYIKLSKEKEVEEYLINVFNKYKEKGLDVFDVDRLLEIHYPKAAIADVMGKTDLEINVNIIIDGTGQVKDSL